MQNHSTVPVKLFIGDYKPDRGTSIAKEFSASFINTDIHDHSQLKKSLAGLDAVIVTVKQREPVVQKVCFENRIHCIDATAFYDFSRKVEKLTGQVDQIDSASLLMAGFFPGLSGILLKQAISDFDSIDTSHVGLLQNTNALAGANGIIDMLNIINQPVPIDKDGQTSSLRGFRRKRNFSCNSGTAKLRLIHHSEAELLKQYLPLPDLQYWTAWNSSFFNLIIAGLLRSGIYNHFIRKLKPATIGKFSNHNANKPETTSLCIEVTGKKDRQDFKRIIFLEACSDYGMTAKMIRILTQILLFENHKGIVYPFQIASADRVLNEIDSTYFQFTDDLEPVTD